MGSSRAAARDLLGVLRDIQRDGVEATLRRLNLASLVGRPAEDVFLGLTEVICRDGGSIDEGLARDAWLETLAELQRFGIEDLGALTEPQVREMFVAFIANTIETRLFQEIGAKGLKVAADNASIEAFQAQLSSYIERGVRDSFSSDLGSLGAMSDGELRELSTMVQFLPVFRDFDIGRMPALTRDCIERPQHFWRISSDRCRGSSIRTPSTIWRSLCRRARARPSPSSVSIGKLPPVHATI